MSVHRSLPLVALLTAILVLPTVADGPRDNIPETVRPIPPKGNELPEAVRTEIRRGLDQLQQLIRDIGQHALLADVLIYEKAVRWALEYDEVYDGRAGKDGKAPTPGGNVQKVLAAGLERARQLQAGKTPWTAQTGPVLRGYISKIDSSVQPYWLVVPKDYDFAGQTNHRLDVWWHGRGETLSEANFMAYPASAAGIIPAPGAFILHPYGRYCNANKFAGEVDTFECLDHVQKHYRIDRNRLVARGFSMGGAACWQFATHYPTLWCAAAPGAGFAETPEFLDVFQKEKLSPTWYEKKLWHLYNATDYALNLFNLPTVAYSGENDSQKQAADVMAREMKKVGLDLVHIIGPKTGHSYEPSAKLEINQRIDAIVQKGKPQDRKEFKFVTYTLRYNQCGPITLTGLGKHWERASVEGIRDDDKRQLRLKTSNVTSMIVHLPDPGHMAKPLPGYQVVIDDTVLGGNGMPTRTEQGTQLKCIKNPEGKWETVQNLETNHLRKLPGLQGPIDDAFLDSLVNVAPTGQPMNAKVGSWVEKELKHATEHWRKQFRGDAPLKKDTAITEEDIRTSNLVLWGDPKSNAILAKIADRLPIKWTDQGVQVANQTFDAGSHVPVLIYPNPLNLQKYVVLNSGFTFREYDHLNNARQVPKLPDYAVIDITTPPNSRYPGKIVRAGFFGERWELLPTDGQ